MSEEAEPKNNKKLALIIGGGGIGFMMIGGILVWSLSGDNDTKPANNQLTNGSPGAGNGRLDGEVRTDPAQITLQPQPDGSYSANVRIMAINEDFQVGNVQVIGDPAIRLNNTCAIPQQIIPAGKDCTVTVSWKPDSSTLAAATSPTTAAAMQNGTAPVNASAPNAASKLSTLRITGATKRANGGSKGIDANPPITLSNLAPGQGNNPAFSGPVGYDGQPIPGAMPPPAGIDTYGAPQGNMQGNPQIAGGTPLQPGAAGAAAPVSPGGSAPPAAPAMSLRDQYILARRQAAFNGAQPRYAQQAPARQSGNWSELKVPTATSSLPQDMSRVLTMDRVITAVLVRPFDSRSSQQVIAQVDRNVYSAAGRNILIPRGSTIIGNMSAGGGRAVVNWTQIIRPDGARFMMKATGGDAMGQAGVPGTTNNRYGARFGTVLLGTLLKAGVAYGTGAASTESAGGGIGATTAQNNGAVITNIVNQDLNQIIQQILADKSRILPVTVIAAGTRLTVFPQQDLAMFAIERETIVRPAYPRPMNGGAQARSFDPDGVSGGGASGDAQPSPYVNAGNGVVQRRTPGAPGRSELPSNIDPNNRSLGSTPPWNGRN